MDWTTLQDSAAWHWLSTHQAWIGPLIGGIAFIESFALVGILIPGVVLLYIAAFIAGNGALPLGTTLFFAFAGAVVGDGASYLIGRYFHRHLPHIWPFSRHRSWLAKGERFFYEYGGLSVVAGRFLGPIRPVMPLVAGSLLMPRWLFFSLNIASALAWAPVYILPGYFAGAAIDDPQHWRNYIIVGLIAVIIIAIGAIWLRDRFRIIG
jgi:undecaprenyl-diphosphatase